MGNSPCSAFHRLVFIALSLPQEPVVCREVRVLPGLPPFPFLLLLTVGLSSPRLQVRKKLHKGEMI